MQDSLAGVGCVGLFIGAVAALYPYIALGRIWHYSKEQRDLLAEIRDLLRTRP